VRVDEFVEGAPGELLPIEGGHAFVPDPLPPRFSPSSGLLRQVANARGALGEFVGGTRGARTEALIMRPLQTSEAILSSRIEGIHTDTVDVILHENEQSTSEPSEPVSEVRRYLSALRLGAERLADGWALSLPLIRGLQEELPRGARGGERLLGSFRQRQVAIGSRTTGSAVERIRAASFVPPPYEHVAPLMDDLSAYLVSPARWDPLIDCAIQHYQFEAIHPFEDGNGRTGRILIPLYLVSQGILERPNLYLSPYFDARHNDYIGLLKRVSTHGDWEAWVRFFVEGVESQAKRSSDRVRMLFELVERYKQTVLAAPRSLSVLPVVDLLAERVIVEVNDVVEFAGVSYPTARSYLDRLAALGIVEPMRDTYPARWIARELLDQVYTA
jgi:Fic family protein